MSVKRPPLVNGQIYHIVLRAVEGLKLFCNEKDFLRMIYNLFEFNDEKSASSYSRALKKSNMARSDLACLVKKGRDKLVDILALCLMPNHIHVLMRQLGEDGISKFMKKIGTGYGLYYNKKYERSGHIFGGRYRAVLVKTNEQLRTVFAYIHANPVAIIFPGWKEKGIKDLKRAIKFLEEEYRWSSYADYLGKYNFPSLTRREFLTGVMEGPGGCQELVNAYLELKRELADFDKVAIE